MYTEGCIVIVEGTLLGSVFQVQAMTFPPIEKRRDTLTALGNVDVFGNNTRPQQFYDMEVLEEESVDAMFVVISDVQIDRPHVSDDACALPLSVNSLKWIVHCAAVSGVRYAEESV